MTELPAAVRDDLKKYLDVLNRLLEQVASTGASEMLLSADFPPSVKLDGKLIRLINDSMSAEHCMLISRSICTDRQWQMYLAKGALSLVFVSADGARFRANLFMHQRKTGMVVYRLPDAASTIGALHLPRRLEKVSLQKSGLVVVASPHGGGRTSTQHAMLHYRNMNGEGHILSIEASSDIQHKHISCIVTQREIGADTPHMSAALADADHQSADALFLSDICDYRSLMLAVGHAKSGRLVVVTVQADDAIDAVLKLVSLAPPDAVEGCRIALSMALDEVFVQHLVRREDSADKAVATELLRMTAPTRSDLAGGRFASLREKIDEGDRYGMRGLGDDLFDLYEKKLISLGDALYHASDREELRARFRANSARYEAEGGKGEGDAGCEADNLKNALPRILS